MPHTHPRFEPEFRTTDEQFARLEVAGELPSERSTELRSIVDHDISNFRLSKAEFQRTGFTAEIRESVTSLQKHAAALSASASSHPEVLSRLTGAALLDEDLGTTPALQRANGIVADCLKGAARLEQLARLTRTFASVGRSRENRATVSNDPPIALFISVLLNFWRYELGRPIRNWRGIKVESETAAPLTLFVFTIFEIAGHPIASLETTKKRIDRVKKRMDRNMKNGGWWSVWSV